jgi:hypothetical protein
MDSQQRKPRNASEGLVAAVKWMLIGGELVDSLHSWGTMVPRRNTSKAGNCHKNVSRFCRQRVRVKIVQRGTYIHQYKIKVLLGRLLNSFGSIAG